MCSQKCFSCLTHTRALGRAGGRAGAFRPPVVIIFIFYLQSIVSGKATLRQVKATAKAVPMSALDIATLIQDAVGRAVTDALAQRTSRKRRLVESWFELVQGSAKVL